MTVVIADAAQANSARYYYVYRPSFLFHRPEGGWEEPKELDLFEKNGFQKVTMGTRVLRSDVAVVSLLALAHEICSIKDVSK